jgi:hypothetical protein
MRTNGSISTLNQARDGALLELEYEDLYARLEGCPD